MLKLIILILTVTIFCMYWIFKNYKQLINITFQNQTQINIQPISESNSDSYPTNFHSFSKTNWHSDTNTITPTEDEEDTTVKEVETTKEGVHTEVKPKRKVKRPTYLHDFAWETAKT